MPKDIPPHTPFVSKIASDPAKQPDTVLVSGYVGPASEQGHTRLYLDPELRTYVEIPNDAILHTQEIPPEQSILGGSLVWIPRNTELIHGTAVPRVKATFLEGRLQQAYGVMAAPRLLGQLAAARGTVLCVDTEVGCVTSSRQCSIHIPCGSTGWDCPTRHGCGTGALCTGTAFCGTGVFVCGKTSALECGPPF